MPTNPSKAPLAEDRAAGDTALLVLDMFSAWDFPDAKALARGAIAIAPRIAALQRRCACAGVPVVFVNDNQGRWRSDSAALLKHCALASNTGAQVAAVLSPCEQDYIVLKPKHSAFFATPLDLLLRHLRVQRVVLTGVAADQCIFLTAVEARMQDYDVTVPADCVAAQTASRVRTALAQLLKAHRIHSGRSRTLRLRRRSPAPS
jgi:nicotinamidase-related amidase